MNPKIIAAIIALVVALLLAAAVGLVKQVGVKSYGTPVGRVVRAGSELAVLMEQREPYLPSLKGRSESDMRYSYALWLIPDTGAAPRTIPVASGIRSGDRMHVTGIRRFENGIVWLATDDFIGIEPTTGAHAAVPVPTSVATEGISTLLPSREPPEADYRLASITPASSPTSAPGPAIKPPANLRRAAFMRSTPSGPPITFQNPDGHLVMHSAGDPVKPTIHLSRTTPDGRILWTVDTQIVRLTQILPHTSRPVFVGERTPVDQLLTVINLTDGTAKTTQLRGAAN